MNLGVQYYRPPFPQSSHWDDDIKKIKDSGLNTLQLWLVWGWIESHPDRFVFDDYDRLVELADKNGLRVVLSTIAEIQPHWIHRIVPQSEMIDHRGHRVISSFRNECHFGLTPGGCTDHPGVWTRMASFLTEATTRYRSAEHLLGWDAWNELRWNVNADGLVCFCSHTISAFHEWLKGRYGSLDRLNAEWKRRYDQWEEVQPGKLPDRTYTEMMVWQHFLTWRANQHGRARYEIIKKLDPAHVVTVHAGDPSPLTAGDPGDYAINRGNDWFYADVMDGIGCSSFPKFYEVTDVDFATRIGYVKSAAGPKHIWLSELQGGRASIGFNIYPPVDAVSQQRWIWLGIAGGADTVLFWCWRDEVFGRESAGFGMAGNDGFMEERLATMKTAGYLLKKYQRLFFSYASAQPSVGVLFSPQSYYHHWAQDAQARTVRDALNGYCGALERQSIAYTVVEEEHLEVLSRLRVLFLPRTVVTGPKVEKALIDFVQSGGTLVCESECGAFSPEGIYRYPEERFLTKLVPGAEVGRRTLTQGTTLTLQLPNQPKTTLTGSQWLTPWGGFTGSVWAENKDGVLAGEMASGKGRVIYCGTYFGDFYAKGPSIEFDRLVAHCAGPDSFSPVEVISVKPTLESTWQIKTGTWQEGTAVWIFFPRNVTSATFRVRKGLFNSDALYEVFAERSYQLTKDEGDSFLVTVETNAWGVSLLTDTPPAKILSA